MGIRSYAVILIGVVVLLTAAVVVFYTAPWIPAPIIRSVFRLPF